MCTNGPERDFMLAAYDYDLPQELIAQKPLARRDASRLMVLERAGGATESRRIAELAELLEPGLIVVNNTKVLPARVMGRRQSGGHVEFLLLTPLPVMDVAEQGARNCAEAECLLRSSKRVRNGEVVELGPDLSCTLLERGDFGRCRVLLAWRGDLAERLATLGSLPLPPYIRRPADASDAERYQTLFARAEKNGSVAAPTAGLHFTPELRERLTRAGHTWTEATLYIGYGTFSPVRVDDIRDHPMHSEYFELSAGAAAAVNAAKAAGRPVTAVGTTAMRTLEGVYGALGRIAPCSGWTDIFLYPGRPVHVVDRLITNFHLPRSTLLMLVSAFAGREATLRAYERAVRERYRFFSYGDAMLIR
jgi:S-adenosylmethionine:tRNA ribosyltransferase-isomerase